MNPATFEAFQHGEAQEWGTAVVGKAWEAYVEAEQAYRNFPSESWLERPRILPTRKDGQRLWGWYGVSRRSAEK